MEGVWATIFICHLIFGGHLLNIPKKRKEATLNEQLPLLTKTLTMKKRIYRSLYFSFPFDMTKISVLFIFAKYLSTFFTKKFFSRDQTTNSLFEPQAAWEHYR